MSETSTAVGAEPCVLVHLERGIQTVTLNRPHRKNALDTETYLLLREAVEDSASNDEVRVTILTGAGGDFSAGADVNPSSGPKDYDVTENLKTQLNPIILAIRNSNKPFLAKVRGACVGFGGNVALACDMIFAAETARFSQIFARIALSSDGGGAFFMARAMGYPKAYELMVTGEMIPAPEAERLGLINRTCKDEELDAAVQAMAERLATGPFLSIQNTKSNLREALTGTLESTLDREAENQGITFKSSDFPEGVMAFLQKRKPNFKGR
jgi:2-(1,2-epoxy-1,2-dihydrophenyl)acetyl-CoA isomerase